MKEFILQRICSPGTPEQVTIPLRQIVKRAISLCENHLEDVAIFLGHVVVTQNDKTELTCEAVLFEGGASTDEMTIQVDLRQQLINENEISVNVQLSDIFRRGADEQKAASLKQKLEELKENMYPLRPTLID